MKNYFENKLYKGFVSHYRFSPKKHKFKYDVFKIFLNLENIEESVKKYSFFSLNKFNIYSFYYKDHLYNENYNPYFQAKNIFCISSNVKSNSNESLPSLRASRTLSKIAFT